MTRKKHKVTNEEIKNFNEMREKMNGRLLNRVELEHVLKQLKYAPTPTFIRCISMGENPPIVHVSHGNYAFNQKPVYIIRLQKVWEDYINYANGKITNPKLPSNEENAVRLLKSLGYIIFKPTQYEKI